MVDGNNNTDSSPHKLQPFDFADGAEIIEAVWVEEGTECLQSFL